MPSPSLVSYQTLQGGSSNQPSATVRALETPAQSSLLPTTTISPPSLPLQSSLLSAPPTSAMHLTVPTTVRITAPSEIRTNAVRFTAPSALRLTASSAAVSHAAPGSVHLAASSSTPLTASVVRPSANPPTLLGLTAPNTLHPAAPSAVPLTVPSLLRLTAPGSTLSLATTARVLRPPAPTSYPPLPASEETFIHVAAREMEEDPDVINKMFERFSLKIIADMKRKVNGRSNTFRSRKDSARADTSRESERFWGDSLPKSQSSCGVDEAPKKEHKHKSKHWRMAKSACHGRRQSMHANLFNLFLQSKTLNFKPSPAKERKLRGKSFPMLTPPPLNLQSSIVGERHDLNAARRAKTVFPFSRYGMLD